ncbi:MAG: Double zinc ribbon [Chloroflexota bacterium]|nr:Double zinc ribbon [Chloroflexota bacterium]
MTSRFRRGGQDRGAWQRPGDGRGAKLQCPSCGLQNDASARFCRNCGLPLGWPQDPVRGTTTRRADLPSERGTGVASVIGLLAAIAVLAAAAFLVLRPSGGGGIARPSASPSVRASVPASSANPGASIGPSTGPSVVPSASAAAPSVEPSAEVTAPPATFPPSMGFTCAPATIADPTSGRWHVVHATWSSSGGVDRVLLDMIRDGDASRPGTLSIESVPLNEVSNRTDMSPPPNADRAVVLTMDRRFTGIPVSSTGTGMTAIRNYAIGQGGDGNWHVVMGVAGKGCHRVGVPAWESDPAPSDIQVQIEVKRP